jgi:chromate transporter
LAIVAVCPGPLAYQLGVYCGYIRFGVLGALLVAIGFGIARFLLVAAVAALYHRSRDAWALRALFYGTGPVVLALVVKACWALGVKILKREPLALAVPAVACAFGDRLPARAGRDLPCSRRAGRLRVHERRAVAAAARHSYGPPTSAVAPLVVPLAAGGTLFLFFFKTGSLVFASGLVIVPFLNPWVVDQYHWLDDRTFLEAVAIGRVSPGPVVITATFVGYLLDGSRVPSRHGWHLFARVFVHCRSYTAPDAPPRATAIAGLRARSNDHGGGVLAGTTMFVGRAAVVDGAAVAIAVAAMALLLFGRSLPEPLLVALGGIAGLAAYR